MVGLDGTKNSDESGVQLMAGQPDEVASLQALEVAAGAPFAEIGMNDIAEADPPPAAVMVAAIEDERLLVAKDGDGLAGFIMWSHLDGEAHIEQVSVHPRAAGRGIGRQLIDYVCLLAGNRGGRSVTLTTFRNVAWNAPLYERYGFSVVESADIGPELAECRRQEIEAGLDSSPRVAMRRVL